MIFSSNKHLFSVIFAKENVKIKIMDFKLYKIRQNKKSSGDLISEGKQSCVSPKISITIVSDKEREENRIPSYGYILP